MPTRRASQRREFVSRRIGHRWPGVAALFVRIRARMTNEPRNHEPETRPVFKFLAGLFGILFLIGGCTAVVFAFQSTGPALRRWILEASLFLLLGAGLIYGALTGRWGLRR